MFSSNPTLLALDTATDRIHAALLAGGGLRAVDLAGGAQASAALLPALSGLLTDAGLTWADLDAIGFGCGPGAFTGLRTACSIAQGLALGLDRPVIAIDTLMAVAEDARQSTPSAWVAGDTVWVAQDARMDELYVGAFTWDGQDWLAVQAPQLWPLDEPRRRWGDDGVDASHRVHLAGSALLAYPSRVEGLAGLRLWPQAAPRGAALAALAARAWRRGDTLDAALALPRYVRDKVAQTTAERQAARSS